MFPSNSYIDISKNVTVSSSLVYFLSGVQKAVSKINSLYIYMLFKVFLTLFNSTSDQIAEINHCATFSLIFSSYLLFFHLFYVNPLCKKKITTFLYSPLSSYTCFRYKCLDAINFLSSLYFMIILCQLVSQIHLLVCSIFNSNVCSLTLILIVKRSLLLSRQCIVKAINKHLLCYYI